MPETNIRLQIHMMLDCTFVDQSWTIGQRRKAARYQGSGHYDLLAVLVLALGLQSHVSFSPCVVVPMGQ